MEKTRVDNAFHCKHAMLYIAACFLSKQTGSMDSIQSKGGRARAQRLSHDERKLIAQNAARHRWLRPQTGSPIPKAIAAGILPIADARIPCAVLDDASNTRVLTQEGFLAAIGRAAKAKGGQGASVDGLPAFLRAANLKPFISNELARFMRRGALAFSDAWFVSSLGCVHACRVSPLLAGGLV